MSQSKPPVEQTARVNFIFEQVCKEMHISYSRMISPQRSQAMLPPRCALAAALRQLTPLSLPQIGDIMHRDHSSISHSLKHARNGYAVWIGPMIRKIEERLAEFDRTQGFTAGNSYWWWAD